MRSFAPSIALLGATLILTACGDDTSGGEGGSTSASTTTTSAQSTAAATSAQSTTTSTGSTGGGGAGGEGAGGDGTGGAGGAGGSGGAGGTGGSGGGGLTGDCFGDEGVAIEVSGSGTCADPWVLDLSAFDPGSVVRHEVGVVVGDPFGSDEVPSPLYGGNCGASAILDGTTTDFVWRVVLPEAAQTVEVSVDPVAGADPRVGVFEDASCGQPLNACADDQGEGLCEYVIATKFDEFYGTTPYVIVSEVIDDPGTVVRFRIDG